MNINSSDRDPNLHSIFVIKIIIHIIVVSIVLTVGVLGNILVLIVILTSKSMRSSTNIFLLNLRYNSFPSHHFTT